MGVFWARLCCAVILACGLTTLAACQESRSAGTPGKPTDGPTPAGPKVLPTSPPAAEAQGKLLYVQVLEMRSFDLARGTSQTFLRFPSGAFGGLPAISPDGTLVAYSLYRPSRSAKEPGGTDLYLVNADGSNPREVLAHDAPGVSLTEPAWGPDGRMLYFTRRTREGASQVERVNADGSERAIVVQNAFNPWVSRDGQRLAYLTLEVKTATFGLWVAGVDGANPKRLLGSPEFLQVAYPRWSPDGGKIVFSAVGGPDGATNPRRSGLSGPSSWFGPSVAYAHGIPWDLWLVNADGSGLKQLTQLDEDSPIATWSPDGQWIAFTGELGLYLSDAEGKRVRRLSEDGGGGGLAWLKYRAISPP